MPYLIIKKSSIGKGVFAGKDFEKNEKIFDFQGKLFSHDPMPIYNPKKDRFIQIGRKLYMGGSGMYDDYINHSCQPNSGVKINGKKAVLVAIKNVLVGQEITFDYSTTMDENNFEMKCLCNKKNCRKKIKDFKYLPHKLKQKYVLLEIVPKYNLKYLNGESHK